MAEPKTDLRVLKTQESIRRAYLELLRDHSAKEITVAQLCRRARINLGTFYLHYRDTQDLLNSIVRDLVEELAAVIRKYPPQQLKDNPFPVIYEAFPPLPGTRISCLFCRPTATRSCWTS